MSDVQLNNVGGRENALPEGEQLAASAIAQFYNFASRCMDWAWTTRSRATGVAMAPCWGEIANTRATERLWNFSTRSADGGERLK